MIKIGIFGASGRMGIAVSEIIESDYADRAAVIARIDTDTGSLDDLGAVDAVIDFSLPAGTGVLIDWMASRAEDLPILICGTTALSEDQHRQLQELGERTIVLYATNFSNGVAAMSAILGYVTPMLESLSYKPSITETHHVHKLDAPSGTAITLSEFVNPDEAGAVEIESVREGEVIGKHDVCYQGVADRIVISHEALDRSLFARGAVDAALWLCDQDDATGNYSMASYFAKRFLD